MTDALNSYIVILIYGSLVLLSFLLISNPLKLNRKANLWFGISLLLWSTYSLEEIFMMSSLPAMTEIISGILKFIQFFTPIFLYIGIVFFSNPDYKFRKSDVKFLFLPFIYLLLLIIQGGQKDYAMIEYLLNILIVGQALFFIILSYYKILQHKKKIHLFASNTSEIDLKWLEYIIIAFIVLGVFIAGYNFLFVGNELNLIANVFSLAIILFVAYNSIKQKEIFLLNENQRDLIIQVDQETAIEKRKIIDDQELESLKAKLNLIMETEEPFLDPELSLVSLAELMTITPHQLSYVINAGFNENFFLFVNKYRVEKVKEMLLKKENSHLSILGIAFESGFNSKTSFNTTFKKISLQTPSEFKKSSSTL